jgi:hypothetical protein
MTIATRVIGSTLHGIADLPDVIEAWRSGDKAKLIEAFTKALGTTLASVASAINDSQNIQTYEGTPDTSLDDTVDDAATNFLSNTNQDRIGDSAGKVNDAMEENRKQIDEAIARMEEKVRTKRLADDRKQMEALIAQARGDAEDGEITDDQRQTLQKIMATLARDRAILSAVDALVSGGAAIAVDFFPGAGAIIAYKEFVQQFAQAIQHTMLFREWREEA